MRDVYITIVTILQNSSDSVLISMLEQQQSWLKTIQSHQEQLRKDMVFAKKRLEVLEDKFKGESSSPSISGERKKIRITRDLTVSNYVTFYFLKTF